MRVYYEHNEKETDAENLQFANLEHKFKYRLMWELRSLEEIINEEGGIIVLRKDGRLQVSDFTKETVESIYKIFSSVDWDKW